MPILRRISRQQKRDGIDYRRLALPKPTTQQQMKALARRHEDQVKRRVRAACVRRDGRCRVIEALQAESPCQGRSTWHHLVKRSLTRGRPAQARHRISESVMLCERHHAQADQHQLGIWPLNLVRGANGPLCFHAVRGKPMFAQAGEAEY